MEKPTFPGFPQILCIFYAEFDIDVGPVVRYEVPEGFVTGQSAPCAHTPTQPDTTAKVTLAASSTGPAPVVGPTYPPFEKTGRSGHTSPDEPGKPSIRPPPAAPYPSDQRKVLSLFQLGSDFIIPQPELKRKLITFYTDQFKILGYPVAIRGEQYQRNELTFNCAFVFRRTDQTACYEPVIKKIAELLEQMEHGIAFLRAGDQKRHLGDILTQLYKDLNHFNESRIVYEPWFNLNLKLFPILPDPPYIHDHEVPVLMSDLARVVDNMWDMTLVRVLEHINGVDHVKKIAERCDIDLELVRSCVQHLLYYECVAVVDILKFTNVYCPLPDIVDTIRKTVSPEEFVAFVSLPDARPVAFADTIRLYFRLKPGVTLSRWMEKANVAATSLDVRRFITFGLVKKLIYRIHKYPISFQPAPCFPVNVARFFSGKYHMDAICTQLNISETDLEDYCRQDRNLHIIH
ncbi:Nitrogen permease regulator 2, partial [Tieghemiomyces parasiticus]